MNRGPQDEPQCIMTRILGPPKKGAPVLWNPHICSVLRCLGHGPAPGKTKTEISGRAPWSWSDDSADRTRKHEALVDLRQDRLKRTAELEKRNDSMIESLHLRVGHDGLELVHIDAAQNAHDRGAQQHVREMRLQRRTLHRLYGFNVWHKEDMATSEAKINSPSWFSLGFAVLEGDFKSPNEGNLQGYRGPEVSRRSAKEACFVCPASDYSEKSLAVLYDHCY